MQNGEEKRNSKISLGAP